MTDIKKEHLVNIGEPGAQHTTRLEVAAVIAEAIYQDFNNPKSKADVIKWGTKENKMPPGWTLVDKNNVPTTIGAKKDSEGNINSDFGTGHPYPFSIPIPNGFRIVNITHNIDRPGKKGTNSDQGGYDAIAIYNDRTRKLMFINSGMHANSDSDFVATAKGGGAQIKPAQDFFRETLKKIGEKPKHITLVGHSLGGVLAVAQAVALIESGLNVDFSVITFDSIGSNEYLRINKVSENIREKIEDHYLAFRGNGQFTKIENTWAKLVLEARYKWITGENPPAANNSHLFGDDLSANKKHPVIEVDAKHEMGNFTPFVLKQAQTSVESHHTKKRK